MMRLLLGLIFNILGYLLNELPLGLLGAHSKHCWHQLVVSLVIHLRQIHHLLDVRKLVLHQSRGSHLVVLP